MENREILAKGAEQLGFTLTDHQLDQFEKYFELLVSWNEKMNLTSITEEKEVIIKHFLDCLAGAGRIREEKELSIVDIGTGAGFPGMVLKIVFPEVPFVLIDSLQKRIGFLEEVVKQLGLEKIELIHGRAEELAHDERFRERFDVVVSRAVASMPVLLEYAMGYVKTGGIFVAYKGPMIEEELERAAKAFQVMQSRLETVLPVTIPYGEYQHNVAVVRKQKPLGKNYPRSQAKIKKQPL